MKSLSRTKVLFSTFTLFLSCSLYSNTDLVGQSPSGQYTQELDSKPIDAKFSQEIASLPLENNYNKETNSIPLEQKEFLEILNTNSPINPIKEPQKEEELVVKEDAKVERRAEVTVQQLQKEFIEKVIVANKFKSRFKHYLSTLCGDIYLNDKCVDEKIAYIKNWNTVMNDKVLINAIDDRVKRLSLDKEKFEQDVLELDEEYWKKIKHQLKVKLKYKKLDRSQFVSLIDLSRQKIVIALYDINEKEFYPVGVDLISSGNMDREASIEYGDDHYFDSPKGIFSTKGGWRSDGEENENGSLGYGAKDRYIFYLGRQKSVRYNTFDREGNKIEDKTKWKLIKDELEFAIHAHESDMPLGGAYSHGCIRTSNELNRFLDSNLVLHKNNINLNDKSWKQKYVPSPKEAKNYTLAGEYVIILDKL